MCRRTNFIPTFDRPGTWNEEVEFRREQQQRRSFVTWCVPCTQGDSLYQVRILRAVITSAERVVQDLTVHWREADRLLTIQRAEHAD